MKTSRIAITKHTIIGWSWTNDGVDNLPEKPETTGTVRTLTTERMDNFNSTVSSYYIKDSSRKWQKIKYFLTFAYEDENKFDGEFNGKTYQLPDLYEDELIHHACAIVEL